MLYELVYPGLCVAEMVDRLAGRKRLAGAAFTYRATRCQMQRREIALLAKISPRLGARLALQRFDAARARVTETAWRGPRLQRSMGIDGAIAERCFGHKGQPRVLLLHGWNSQSRTMWPLAQALAAKGLRVVVPDHPGEGANPYALLSFTQKAQALAMAYAETEFHAVISHSAGGLIAAQAIENGLRTTSLATICSPVSMATLLQAYLVRTAAPASVFDAILLEYAGREGRQAGRVGTEVFGAYAGRMQVIHAQSDWQVKAREAEEIGALAETAPILLDRCNHHTILTDARVHDILADFVTSAAPRGGVAC